MNVRLVAIICMALSVSVCKPSSVFTEIDASFKSLEDVFVAEFRNENRQVEKNTDLSLEASEALTGRYGTTLTLDVWEFRSETDCRAAYDTLTALEKQNQPREYNQTRAAENRYQFVRQTGIAGEIFTIKKVLFRVLATDKNTIAEYLIASKLARAR
ncbi:MAG: hypothetical protein OHK0011_24960 [Turneriella sp.]